jgi:hypothetical protein
MRRFKMDDIKVLDILDSIEEFMEIIYLEVTDIKAMLASAREKGLNIDLHVCLQELGNSEECYKALNRVYACLLKMKVKLLENDVVMNREEFLKYLIEIKIREI